MKQNNNKNNLYSNIVIIDIFCITDVANYGGMLYDLKRSGFLDSKAYQIDNASDLLMYRNIYKKCKNIFKKFRAEIINLQTKQNNMSMKEIIKLRDGLKIILNRSRYSGL